MATIPFLPEKVWQENMDHRGQNPEDQGQSITEDVSSTVETTLPYNQLQQKFDQLVNVNEVQEKLLGEVLKGVSLNQIVTELFNITQFPWVIHNVHGHPISSIGVETLSKGLTPNILYQYISNHTISSASGTIITINRNQDQFLFLTKPFFLNEKRVGYCSIIINNESFKDIAMLLIDKVATVCSLCLLYEKTKIDSSEQMKSLFLRDIINGQFISEDEMITKSGLFDFDLRKPYYLCFLGYQFNQENFQNELVFAKEIMECIKYFNKQQNIQMLMNHEDHHINLLVNQQFQQNQDKCTLFSSLITHLTSRFPGSHFYMGVSNRTKSILTAPNAYNEANVAKRMITTHRQVVFYESLGMIGTLINEQNQHEIRKMSQKMLGNLDINVPKNVDLVRTLYYFLVNGGNLEKTAEELSLSISGLRYRVNKIEELLHGDLRSPVFSCQLLMGIQGLILLGDLDINNILEY